MQNSKTNTPPAPARPTTSTSSTTPANHGARTFFASVFGMLAVLLIMSSIVSIWLNRTLTDTNTFVAVVGPLATKPEIQNFVAQKASEELVKNAPAQDLAAALLPAGTPIAGQTDEQLRAALQPIVYKNVIKVVSSPAFAQAWTSTNQTAHTTLVNQLNGNSNDLSLDLNPLVVSVVNQLKTTDLGQQVGDQLVVKPDTGKLDLQGSGISKAHSSYTQFKRSTILVIVLALACVAASIALSVHHLKTIRRILLGTGVASLLLALSIQVPSVVALKVGDATTQKAVVVIMQSVFHNLQVASLIIGLVCIVVAIGLKVFEKLTTKR